MVRCDEARRWMRCEGDEAADEQTTDKFEGSKREMNLEKKHGGAQCDNEISVFTGRELILRIFLQISK